MTKVLIATTKPFAPVAVEKITDILKTAGYQVILLEKYSEKKALLEAVADVDAAIIRSDIFDREVLEAGKNLKIVVRAGCRVTTTWIYRPATENNQVVMNTPGQNANAVAELAIGMAIMGLREMFSGKPGWRNAWPYARLTWIRLCGSQRIPHCTCFGHGSDCLHPLQQGGCRCYRLESNTFAGRTVREE